MVTFNENDIVWSRKACVCSHDSCLPLKFLKAGSYGIAKEDFPELVNYL